MSNRPNTIEARAWRAENEDGVIELLMALFLLVPALTLGAPAFSWMVALPVLGARRITHRIRSRLTYPRIGFVEARRESPTSIFTGMALWSLVALALVGLLIFAAHRTIETSAWRQFAPLLAALLCCGGFSYARQRTGLHRYVFFAVCALLLGSMLTWAPGITGYLRVQLFLLLMAAIAGVSSLFLMWRFARRYPILEASDG